MQMNVLRNKRMQEIPPPQRSITGMERNSRFSPQVKKEGWARQGEIV
jgi:hypothetical protein